MAASTLSAQCHDDNDNKHNTENDHNDGLLSLFCLLRSALVCAKDATMKPLRIRLAIVR